MKSVSWKASKRTREAITSSWPVSKESITLLPNTMPCQETSQHNTRGSCFITDGDEPIRMKQNKQYQQRCATVTQDKSNPAEKSSPSSSEPGQWRHPSELCPDCVVTAAGLSVSRPRDEGNGQISVSDGWICCRPSAPPGHPRSHPVGLSCYSSPLCHLLLNKRNCFCGGRDCASGKKSEWLDNKQNTCCWLEGILLVGNRSCDERILDRRYSTIKDQHAFDK